MPKTNVTVRTDLAIIYYSIILSGLKKKLNDAIFVAAINPTFAKKVLLPISFKLGEDWEKHQNTFNAKEKRIIMPALNHIENTKIELSRYLDASSMGKKVGMTPKEVFNEMNNAKFAYIREIKNAFSYFERSCPKEYKK